MAWDSVAPMNVNAYLERDGGGRKKETQLSKFNKLVDLAGGGGREACLNWKKEIDIYIYTHIPDGCRSLCMDHLLLFIF